MGTLLRYPYEVRGEADLHETTERHLASSGNCFPDRDERIGPDLAFRGNEIGADVVEVVDLLARGQQRSDEERKQSPAG